jgi:DNA-binding response OmpR family regulator
MAKKILLIDDDLKIIKLVESRLKANGYDVISAKDGKSGIEKAKRESPDLILLDIMMPEIDGYQVIERLKKEEDTKSIPVVMLTAKRDLEDIDKSMNVFGAVGFISKPFSPAELLQQIKNALVFFGKGGK